jgi:hypothetical protein
MWSMSIGMPEGSVCEGVCIVAGVVVVGGACGQRKENGVCKGVEYVIVEGGEWGVWGIMESLICELVEV